jgi:branched-chain amino acid transport system substrate-binding protein
MKKRLKVSCVFGLVMGLAMMFSVGTALAEKETIKLGIMYAMTGKGSALGTKQMDSAKLAVKEINAAGGADFGGKKVMIEAIYQDTETKPDVAVRKMKSMIKDDGITALVGGTFAHVSLAMNAQTKRTPIIFTATNGVPEKMFTKKLKGPYSMSMIPPAESIGSGAAAYVAEVMKLKNVVVMLPDYAYGHGALRGIKNVFDKMPQVKYTTIMTPVGTADMTPFLIKAMEAKPDIVMMGQWGNDAINILKQAYELGLNKKSKIFFNWIVNVFATGIPPEALKGVMCQLFWYFDMTGFEDAEVVKLSNEFTKRYMAEYGEPPDPYGCSAYMGVKNVIRAMELAKSTDPKKAYDAMMANPKWIGPKGPATWMIDGNPRYKYASFVGLGLGADERKSKWDYVKIIDYYGGKQFQRTPAELGWK